MDDSEETVHLLDYEHIAQFLSTCFSPDSFKDCKSSSPRCLKSIFAIQTKLDRAISHLFQNREQQFHPYYA